MELKRYEGDHHGSSERDGDVCQAKRETEKFRKGRTREIVQGLDR